jgi:hypothetical protein
MGEGIERVNLLEVKCVHVLDEIVCMCWMKVCNEIYLYNQCMLIKINKQINQ